MANLYLRSCSILGAGVVELVASGCSSRKTPKNTNITVK